MIKLSQCMIVKNEERNIEHALDWAKPVVFEQIVVDTGSTDKTVELAKKKGAIVYHFEWIDDFSAAKNFAIDKATGDWILLFDADEYMSSKDTDTLKSYLNNMQNDLVMMERCFALNCNLINVDDNGKAMSIYDAMRIFKNDQSIRYEGRIHERLTVNSENVVWSDELSVIHTGYSESSMKETNKIDRNIKLLRKAIALDENNLALKVYLADSLKMKEDKESQEEAEGYFAEAIEHGIDKIFYKLRVKAYIHFMNKYVNDPTKHEKCEELCNRALSEFPGSLDFKYFLASLMNYRGDYREVWDMLRVEEEQFSSGKSTGISHHVQADPTMLYSQLLLAAQGLGNMDEVIKYAKLILGTDKTRQDVLSPLIALMLGQDGSGEALLNLLSEIYDMNDPNDLLIIARAAKTCGAIEFAGLIMQIAKEIMGR